jgi:hypothetical protein
MAERVSQDELYERYPQIRSFIADRSKAMEAELIAAFVGVSGPFGVYATRIDRNDPVPGVVFVCGFDGSIMLAELEGGAAWFEESAMAVAEALADGAITGTRTEQLIRIGAREENAAFERARKSGPARVSDVTIISGPFEGFPARLVQDGAGAVIVEVMLFGKATRVRLSPDEVRRK